MRRGNGPIPPLHMSVTIRWYSTGLDLNVQEHEALELPAALKLVDRYFSNLGRQFESGEANLAATQFGFCRGKDDFVEICLFSEEQIWVTVEHPLPLPASRWKRLLAPSQFHCKVSLGSREDVKRHVSWYFTLDLAGFRERLVAA